MDPHTKCEGSAHSSSRFKCLSHPQKTSSSCPADNPVSVDGIEKMATQTPQKTSERLKEAAPPERYESFPRLFHALTSSLRLLSLCKNSPSFRNVSAQVQVFVRRELSYRDLAQMKFLLPEAIQVDQILLHDANSLCMKPDLKISLLFDVIEGHHEKSDFLALHQLFAARLRSFYAKHPEMCDIPEAALPEPFGRQIDTTSEKEASEVIEAIMAEKLRVDSLDNSFNDSEELSESSLLFPLFNRCFSRKAVTEIKKPELLLSHCSLLLTSQGEIACTNSDYGITASRDMRREKLKETSDDQSSSPNSDPSVKLVSPGCCNGSNTLESPQQNHAMSADSIMIETPAQLTPRRVVPDSDDKMKSVFSQLTAGYKPAKRSLYFPNSEADETALNSSIIVSNSRKLMDDKFSRNLRTKSLVIEDNAIGSLALRGKEELFLGSYVGDKISELKTPISFGLSALVQLIDRIFQSANCLAITREELINKIIITNIDISERREVEEQIELLEKMVPDWLCRKLAPSGDIMYTIAKGSD